ncbi:MAG: hypothetical protein ACI9ON_002458 [Limisphaerales bacterium]|jgi:hypothetical protein
MDMIGHKHPSMYGYFILCCTLSEPVCIGGDISVAGKAHLAVISSLDDMNGVFGWAKSWLARHLVERVIGELVL